MEKLDFSPSRSASRRRIRTQAEWNVETHIDRARGPTASSTRSRISAAALLVNVMARISPGRASPVASRWAIRRVRTRVLPGAGAGHDEQRTAAVLDGGALGRVEPGDEFGDRRRPRVLAALPGVCRTGGCAPPGSLPRHRSSPALRRPRPAPGRPRG